MRAPPLSVLATWPTPNYVNPETRGPANIIVISILLGFVTIILGIRIYTRTRISKGFGWDDVLIILAWIPATAFAIAGMDAEYRFQWNRHVWDVEPQLATGALQLSLATVILFDIATNLTKLSMLALIYKLMLACESRMRFVAIGLSIFVACDSMVFVLVTIFQCRPVSDFWTISLTPQNCINGPVHILAAGIINTAVDFIIVFLPLKTILDLKIPLRQRIIVYSLFTGGLLASAAGAVRTYFAWVMVTAEDHDITWRAYIVILTSSLELYIGIICASLPATKPFFGRYIPRLLGTSAWTNVTEPLEERKKRLGSGGNSSFSFRDVESADFPLQSPPPRAPMVTRFYTPYRPPQQEAYYPTPPASNASFGLTSPKTLSPPNLNKPLPRIMTQTERNTTLDAMLANPYGGSNMVSVYDFKAYADGHISVHKTKRSRESSF